MKEYLSKINKKIDDLMGVLEESQKKMADISREDMLLAQINEQKK